MGLWTFTTVITVVLGVVFMWPVATSLHKRQLIGTGHPVVGFTAILFQVYGLWIVATQAAYWICWALISWWYINWTVEG